MNYLQLDETALNRNGALWTAREIAQQPESWIRTQELLRERAAPIAGFLDPVACCNLICESFSRGPEVRPSSVNASRRCCMQKLDRRVEAIATTDLLSGPHQYFQPDVPTLLVSFGRSGSSPESVAVVDLAERLLRECHQLVFTCNEQGTLYQRCLERRNSLAILLPPETHDQSFAMTSSFTAMMLAAALVFHGLENATDGVPRIARGEVAFSSHGKPEQPPPQ